MKISDYILDFIVGEGVADVFGITGGFIAPLFDAFHGRTDIRYYCTQHEQAAAMAADAYARFRGLGVCMSTSGPGATNLITGIGCSYFDSIPVLCITGQVPRSDARGKTKVRQRGFQETDIVSIVKPITKYAVHVSNPKEIGFELRKAVMIARSGRPGPVLVDIPMDVLRADYDEAAQVEFTFPVFETRKVNQNNVACVVAMITEAKRPVIVYGQGARHAKAELLQFIEMTGIPCLPSWAGLDIIPHDHPLYVDQFGVYGSRAGNYTIQNADLIITIGTRMDGRMTGSNGFAPKAKKVIVDIDEAEASKLFGIYFINDAKDWLDSTMGAMAKGNAADYLFSDWRKRIAEWKEKYPILPASDNHPVAMLKMLNDVLPDDAIIIPDCGGNLSWSVQSLRVKPGQNVFSAYGYSPMGYAVAAAIGATVATGRMAIAIIGDGGMQVNIQELHTLKVYNLPVKIFVINNDGYGIIRQFQDELYEGRYEATNISPPDFQRIAEAYGVSNWRIINPNCMCWMPAIAINAPGPAVCEVIVDRDAKIYPKTQYGNPIDRQHPLLDADEHAENMTNETD